MKKIDNSMTDKEWYHIYWSYFELMSGQRISMLNFYITIEVVLFGGIFALLQLQNRMKWAECLVALAIVLMSIVFYGIDYRTKTMIHRCEELMTRIEDRYKPYQFGADPIHYINKKSNIWEHMTYSKWFTIQFIAIGGMGMALLIMLYKGII